ncbi:MAG: Ig-like domain-containing protein, partial [Armatimonadota bacterium]
MNEFRPKARMPRLRMFALAVVLAVLAGGLVISGAAMAQVKISSTSPAHNDLNVDPTAPIVITFDGDLNPAQDLLGGVNPRVRIAPATGEGGQALGLSATISGNRITITHSVPFEQSKFYQVTVGRIWKKNETVDGPDPTPVTTYGPKLQNPWL